MLRKRLTILRTGCNKQGWHVLKQVVLKLFQNSFKTVLKQGHSSGVF